MSPLKIATMRVIFLCIIILIVPALNAQTDSIAERELYSLYRKWNKKEFLFTTNSGQEIKAKIYKLSSDTIYMIPMYFTDFTKFSRHYAENIKPISFNQLQNIKEKTNYQLYLNIIGASIGIIAGVAIADSDAKDGIEFILDPAYKFAGGIIGGAIGILTGTLIGLYVKEYRIIYPLSGNNHKKDSLKKSRLIPY